MPGFAVLNALQVKEAVSDLSMRAVMEDLLKLSELVKIGSAYYLNAKSLENEEITKIIFSKLTISEDTLQHKCKNGFAALENRNLLVCDPTGWISELLRLAKTIKASIEELRCVLKH